MNIHLAAAFAATLTLSACANAVKPSELPQMRIVDVQVEVNPGVQAASDISTKVRQSSLAAAQAYNAYMPADAPLKTMQINIDKVHYKNPLASLLIGDANSIAGVVAGGVTPATRVGYLDAGSGAINGIAGAVIAAASDKAKADTRLAKGLANSAVAKVYGQNSVPMFVSRHMEGRPTKFTPQRQTVAAQAPTGNSYARPKRQPASSPTAPTAPVN
ncbi:hypothetical protein ACFQ14_02490 [Pseudahrensia aquimaris]|uniref:Lipoprotein n=1 Tax=Pseudahrensia aquimaris TaxID=744461 RepID=A0ABW3FEL1_9HYPH